MAASSSSRCLIGEGIHGYMDTRPNMTDCFTDNPSVTLDYATSTYYPSDPFNPSHPGGYALSIPLPSAISAFVVPHRGSANFFDVLESLHLWSRLEAVGVVTQVAGGEGYVPVGGMRWVEEGVRMWGGVPS